MSPILWGINVLCILFPSGEDITDTITALDPQGCDGEELDDDFVFGYDPDYQPGVRKVLLHVCLSISFIWAPQPQSILFIIIIRPQIANVLSFGVLYVMNSDYFCPNYPNGKGFRINIRGTLDILWYSDVSSPPIQDPPAITDEEKANITAQCEEVLYSSEAYETCSQFPEIQAAAAIAVNACVSDIRVRGIKSPEKMLPFVHSVVPS